MLFNMSHPAIDRLIHFCAQLLYDVSHFLSQLLLEYCEVCCGDHVCLLLLLELPQVLLLPQCCAVPARGVDHRRSATMSNASLFCGTLEPTRMRWECGQVRVTKLRKGKQPCKSATVSSLCTDQQTGREKERDLLLSTACTYTCAHRYGNEHTCAQLFLLRGRCNPVRYSLINPIMMMAEIIWYMHTYTSQVISLRLWSTNDELLLPLVTPCRYGSTASGSEASSFIFSFDCFDVGPYRNGRARHSPPSYYKPSAVCRGHTARPRVRKCSMV